MKNRLEILTFALVMLAFLTSNTQLSTAYAQGTTAFTYQGQLRDYGTNANGSYTMIFNLYDSASGGNLIDGPVTTTTPLVNGLFTVNLDFGANAFSGSARYLDITIDSQELSPRVQVLPSPYAIFAGMANTASNLLGVLPAGQLTNAILSAQLGGTYSNAMTFNNANNSFNGNFNGNGRSLTNLNASALASGIVPGLQLGGDYPNAVTFGNSGNSFTGNGNGLADLNANNLNGEISDNLLSTNIPLLDADQTFGGQNTFDEDVTFNQNIVIGDWNINVGEFDGFDNTLIFYNDGSFVFGMTSEGDIAMVPNDGNYTVGIMPGELGIHGDIDMNGGPIYDCGTIFATESIVSGDASLGGDLTVGGTIYGTVSDGGGNAIEADADVTEATSNSPDILSRITQLKISSWDTKNKKSTMHHISPSAYNFNRAFGFGDSTNLISLTDENGVALAAIQGLDQKLEAEDKLKDEKIDGLEKQLAELKAQVKALTDLQTAGAK